jgi:hypothetical protein
MDKFNTNIFYESSDILSKNKKSPKVPNSVFRQELATWEHTDSGIKRTTVVRSFNGNGQIDSYISEPMAFKKAP